MKRIVLFRFHDYFDVCRDRVALIKSLNPDVEIHGLYGGPEADKDSLSDLISVYAPSLSNQLGNRMSWAWKNGDLGVRAWYALFGRELEFDMLHLLEWDLLILEPLEKVFAAVGPNEVGLTGLKSLADTPYNWPWRTMEPWASEWEGLLVHVRKTYGFDGFPQACQGPGMCFPKSFLDRYTDAHVLQLSNDELRVPLYAQAMGFRMVDTGIISDWTTPFFNCRKNRISRAAVECEMTKPDGCRVFHPFFEMFGGTNAQGT
jgi:hypothetical protein